MCSPTTRDVCNSTRTDGARVRITEHTWVQGRAAAVAGAGQPGVGRPQRDGGAVPSQRHHPGIRRCDCAPFCDMSASRGCTLYTDQCPCKYVVRAQRARHGSTDFMTSLPTPPTWLAYHGGEATRLGSIHFVPRAYFLPCRSARWRCEAVGCAQGRRPVCYHRYSTQPAGAGAQNSLM